MIIVILCGVISSIVTAVIMWLIFNPSKAWDDGYIAAKKTFSDWNNGYEVGFKAARDYYSRYDNGYKNGWNDAMKMRDIDEMSSKLLQD